MKYSLFSSYTMRYIEYSLFALYIAAFHIVISSQDRSCAQFSPSLYVLCQIGIITVAVEESSGYLDDFNQNLTNDFIRDTTKFHNCRSAESARARNLVSAAFK